MKKETKIWKFLTTDIKLINSYLLIGLVCITVIITGSLSYALFTYEKTSTGLIKLTAGNLNAPAEYYNNGEYLSTTPGEGWTKMTNTMIYSEIKTATEEPTNDYSVIVSTDTQYRIKITSDDDWGEWESNKCFGETNLCESRTIYNYKNKMWQWKK